MNRRFVVGLVGPSGAGKGEVVKRLAERHGFVPMHVAEVVKDAAVALGLSQIEVRGSLREVPCEVLGMATPRQLMEAMGRAITEVSPKLCAITWRREFDRIPRVMPVVVDGIRRTEEADAVRAAGGVIVRVDNDDPGDPEKPMDQMQQGVVPDLLLPNRGTLTELWRRVDHFVSCEWFRESVFNGTFGPNDSREIF